MFQLPKQSAYVPPAEPIDINQRYLLRLVGLEDAGVSKFADPDDPNPTHRIRWTFRMATLDGAPILDTEGNPYEHYDYTSNKTSKGKKTAQARLWMEALVGRALEDDEIDGQIASRIKGEVAVALFEEVQAGGDGTDEYTRLRILRLGPYKAAAGSARNAAPAPAPRRQAAAVSAAVAERWDDDEAPPPF